MADALLPLSPAAPGGQIEDVEQLTGAAATTVVRQRVQMAGAILAEIARVQNTDPTGTEYALVVRNIPRKTSTSVVTRVVASIAAVSLLAANVARKGGTFYNQTATGKLFLLLSDGSPASATHFTVTLLPGGYYELPVTSDGPFDGEVDGIWDVADGAVQVTELS